MHAPQGHCTPPHAHTHTSCPTRPLHTHTHPNRRHPALPEADALVRRQPTSVLRAAPSACWLLLHGSALAKALLHELLGGTEDPPAAVAAAAGGDINDEEGVLADLRAPNDSITTSLNSFRPSPHPSRTGSSSFLNSRTQNGALPSPRILNGALPSPTLFPCSPMYSRSHLGPRNPSPL